MLENGASILTNYTQILRYFSTTISDLKLNISDNSKTNIETKLCITSNENNKKILINNKKVISSEYKSLYQYIQKNAPVSSEQIYSHFVKESISILNSKLVLMELKNLIIKRGEKFFIA